MAIALYGGVGRGHVSIDLPGARNDLARCKASQLLLNKSRVTTVHKFCRWNAKVASASQTSFTGDNNVQII
jgi:hypothetical protein